MSCAYTTIHTNACVHTYANTQAGIYAISTSHKNTHTHLHVSKDAHEQTRAYRHIHSLKHKHIDAHMHAGTYSLVLFSSLLSSSDLLPMQPLLFRHITTGTAITKTDIKKTAATMTTHLSTATRNGAGVPKHQSK